MASSSTSAYETSGSALPDTAVIAAKKLISFADRSAVKGGFGFLDVDGELEADRPVATFVTARMTFSFSIGHLLDPAGTDLQAATASHPWRVPYMKPMGAT